ncbi:MAG TPA: hypothetical protein VGR62_19530 [Candidatus Binatia bacterium]|jgi:hypothetical protein|nr:hypothetical protein [Candidatus Binatia bacterium]
MAGVRLALVAFALLALARPVVAQVPCASPAPDDCVITASITVPTGTEWDVGTRALSIAAGKTVTVQTYGYFTIRAASITLESGAKIVANGADGYGGLVSLETSGNIELKSLTRIDVSANEAAGVITIASNAGTLVSQGELRAKASNKLGSGGFVSLLGDASVTIGGEGIDASGGSMADGGYVEIYSSGGVTVSSLLNASGGDYGAGEVDIDAEGSVVTSSAGLIDVQSRNGSGSGGAVLVSSRLGVSLGAGVVGLGSAGGSDGDGYGAEVELYAETGDVVVSAPLDLRGGGANGYGGLLTVSAGGAITIGQQVLASAKANGFGRGGEIELDAGTSLAITSTVDVRGGIIGGSLEGTAGTTASIPGTVLASGTTLLPPATSPRAGLITVTACSIDLPAGGVLTNLGTADPERGINTLRASTGMSIGGTMTAGNANELEWRDVAPTLLPSRSVTPAEHTIQNVALPCCGNCTTTTTSSTTTTTTTSSSTTSSSSTTTTSSSTTTTAPPTTTTTTTSTSTSSTLPEPTTTTIAPTSTTIAPTTTSTTTSTTTTLSDDTTTTTSTVAPTTTTTSSTVAATSTTSSTEPSLPTTTTTTLPTECTDLPLAGFEAVDCRLDTIDTTLAAESIETLGGKKWATRLDKSLTRARSAVAVARTGRKVTPSLRRANQQLRTFQKSLTRAQSKGMPAILGNRLMVLASGATNEIGALRSAQR